MLRILFYRFNRHNAWRYEQAAQQVLDTWWAQHRQTAALRQCVLLGPVCSTAAQCQTLFSTDPERPVPQASPAGSVVRMLRLLGAEADRERQLARQLVLSWREQYPEVGELRPLHCYWQGSTEAWAVFVEQMAVDFPQVRLPAQPEPWQGLDSLEAIVDQLYQALPEARILCAGCEVALPGPGFTAPAGEAAVLWVLGREGGPQLSRGEWQAAEGEDFSAVAERALLQGGLEQPPPACVSFCGPVLDSLQWHARTCLQEDHFGTLPSLQGLVALSLAASQAQSSQAACAWLARDPVHPLTLGVVRPYAAA